MRKYKLTNETVISGRRLYRIVAVRDFAEVSAGDDGGWVASEANLSHDDEAVMEPY